MLSNAISAAAIPAPNVAIPNQSSRRVDDTGALRTSLSASRIPIMPSGMFTMNNQRHEATVAIAPPSAGPTTGAASAGHARSARSRLVCGRIDCHATASGVPVLWSRSGQITATPRPSRWSEDHARHPLLVFSWTE